MQIHYFLKKIKEFYLHFRVNIGDSVPLLQFHLGLLLLQNLILKVRIFLKMKKMKMKLIMKI